MLLITMAHHGEAQSIIDYYQLTKLSSDVYQGAEITILITGEGPFEAAIKTSHLLGQHSFKHIINLGIAGTLNPELKIGNIYPVRSLYLVVDGKMQFKSFQSGTFGVDCLTSFERVLNPQQLLPLKGMGQIVDREAWGVAYAAKLKGIEFSAHKLISDMAGTLGACESIKDNALEWSLLIQRFLDKDILKNPEQINPLPDDFYFSFSMNHQLSQLLWKLSLKENKTISQVIAELPLTQFISSSENKKDRSKALLAYLDEKLDPLKKSINLKLMAWKKPFQDNGIELITDPNLEDDFIKISFHANSDELIKEKAQFLNNLSFSDYQNILEGKFHVE